MSCQPGLSTQPFLVRAGVRGLVGAGVGVTVGVLFGAPELQFFFVSHFLHTHRLPPQQASSSFLLYSYPVGHTGLGAGSGRMRSAAWGALGAG